jgi:carbon monoxide dehydrogenase subunit G
MSEQGDQIIDDLRQRTIESLQQSGEKIVNSVKKELSGTGKSRRGQHPSQRSGKLKGSINWQVVENGDSIELHINADASYAPILQDKFGRVVLSDVIDEYADDLIDDLIQDVVSTT